MKPDRNTKCECCGKGNLWFLIDGRLREASKLGAKDHWVFLCLVCWTLHGKGYDEDDYILYQLHMGRYFEVKGAIALIKTAQEVAEMIKSLASNVDKTPDDEIFITLMGETAIQLAGIREAIENAVKVLAPKESNSDQKVTEHVNSFNEDHP